MSTMVIEAKSRSRRMRASAERRAELFQEIRTAARDVARHRDLDGLLRVVCRELLPALTSSRREEVESFEAPLRFVAGLLSRTNRTADNSEIDRLYLIGRVESLLDLCAIAADQLVAAAVIERVKKRGEAISVLCAVATRGDVRRAELAAEAGVGSEQAFSNLLKWMEDAELIRRRSFGRETLVGLGAKGEAAFCMLRAERSVAHEAIQEEGSAPGQAVPIEWDVAEQSTYALDNRVLDECDKLLVTLTAKEALRLSPARATLSLDQQHDEKVAEASQLAYAA